MSNRGLVRLNVYDLAEQNAYLYWAGVGIFHSGVEVYDVEFAYGEEPAAPPPLATSARASSQPRTIVYRGPCRRSRVRCEWCVRHEPTRCSWSR